MAPLAPAATKAPPPKSLALDIFQGALASCMAVTLSNPLEVIKIRLQLQGELARRGQFQRHYNGVLHGMAVVARTEGLRALQKGLISAYWYQIAMNGTRLGIYDSLVRTLTKLTDAQTATSLPATIACAATVGLIGAAVGSPFYLVKTRLQSAGGAVGQQYQYKGMWNGLAQIYRTTGTRGLWRGADAAMMRTMVGSSTQLTTYSFSKRLVERSGVFDGRPAVFTHAGAAMVSGVMVAAMMNPFDVVSTRLYNQSPDQPLYRGPLDCFAKIFRTEGPAGFLKGVGAHYLRIGPHTFFTFIFWEQIKYYMNTRS